jgi:D-alanyl-D-alanine carboxypeptidase
MAIIARALLREFPDHADLFDIGALQFGNQIIRNHNGLLGRYPGADGMKTGFTCPAGWNLVASAGQYGRHLIAVVLGAPTARLRNQETADLLDRGFAMGSGSGSLDSLGPTASGGAPNMRSNVCLHRSAAAIVAAEEEESAAEPVRATGSGGRGGVVYAVAAAAAPSHTQLSAERPVFQPVRVFIGPVAGWKGPVLAARPTAGDALPANAKAYSAEKTGGTDEAAGAGEESSAPTALQGAVVTPPPTPQAPKRGKRAGKAAAAAKPAKPKSAAD